IVAMLSSIGVIIPFFGKVCQNKAPGKIFISPGVSYFVLARSAVFSKRPVKFLCAFGHRAGLEVTVIEFDAGCDLVIIGYPEYLVDLWVSWGGNNSPLHRIPWLICHSGH
ncbi:MAG: hypothetical protein MK005_19940, partial [Alcanivorax sp.]|nr:hypothetical protein [Alcanivorax sp.]